jgi:hypothetical protein
MADIVIPASCNENTDVKNIIDSVKKYFSVWNFAQKTFFN